MNLRLALIATLGFSTFISVAKVETADARRFGGGGRISVRGGGGSFSRGMARAPRFGGSARYFGGSVGRYNRPVTYGRYNRGWGVGGRVWTGRGYYPRSYRPYYYGGPYWGAGWGVGWGVGWGAGWGVGYGGCYGCGYAYQSDYYPVAPATAAPSNVVVAVPSRPPLPKFGIGAFAGGVSVEDQNESSDLGLLGRYRLTDGLLIEGEIGQTSYADSLRLDRRLGASLVYEIGAHNRFAPYVLGGLGVQQAEVGGEFTTTQNFAELGVGLRYAVSPGLHLLFDVRAGSRATVSDDGVTVQGSIGRVAPPSRSSGETEEYTRARLSAVLYF